MTTRYPLAPVPSEAGIYALICRFNGKIYVGQTVNFRRRHAEWKGAITGGFRVSNSNIALMLKECPDWDMVILKSMPGATKAELDAAEIMTIKKIREKNPELLLNHLTEAATTANRMSYLEGNEFNSNVVITFEGKRVSKKQAALFLGISPETIKKRLQNLHRKHGITSVALEDMKPSRKTA